MFAEVLPWFISNTLLLMYSIQCYMATTDRIAKLFGGMAFVRLARIFLLHPGTAYDAATLREKTRIEPGDMRVMLNDLVGSSVIKKRGGKWMLNESCDFLHPLHDLLIGKILSDINLGKRIERCGAVKLLIAAGVFLDDSESRTDLLIVIDKLNQKALSKTISALETDVGSEVSYAVFTPAEFAYRMSVNDKLLRDILDYPHVKLINKLLP